MSPGWLGCVSTTYLKLLPPREEDTAIKSKNTTKHLRELSSWHKEFPREEKKTRPISKRRKVGNEKARYEEASACSVKSCLP